MIDLNLNPSKKELRQFAIFQLLFCLLVSGWLVYKYQFQIAAIAISLVSVIILIVGRVKPKLIRFIFVLLMVITFPIGWVVSHVIIFAVYYLLITPIGIIMKLVGYDPLHRKIDKNKGSYWIKRPENKNSDRYFRQY